MQFSFAFAIAALVLGSEALPQSFESSADQAELAKRAEDWCSAHNFAVIEACGNVCPFFLNLRA